MRQEGHIIMPRFTPGRLARAPRRMVTCALLLLGVAVLTPQEAAAKRPAQPAASVDVRVEPEVVEVGGTAEYTITASSPDGREIQVVREPDLRKFLIMGRSIMPQFFSRNGVSQRALTVSYRVRPRERGSIKIAPPVVQIGNSKHTGRAVSLKVVPRGKAPRRRAKKTDAAYIDVVLRPGQRKPYVGEQITATYNLMMDTRRISARPHLPSDPSLDDFWIEDLSVRRVGEKQLVRRGGRFYEQILLKEYALFPLRAGTATVDSMQSALVTNSFLQPGRQLQIESEPIKLDVQPLPPGAPEGFDEGNVGQWRLEVSADAVTGAIGRSIEVRVTARGFGQVGRVKLPRLSEIEGARLIPGDEDTTQELRKRRVYGVRTAKYALTPLREGKLRVPPLSFSYFDPARSEYRTIKSPALTLHIEGGALPPEPKRKEPVRARKRTSAEDMMSALRGKLRPPMRSPGSGAPPLAPERSPVFWLLFIAGILGVFGTAGAPLARRVASTQSPARRRKLAARDVFAQLDALQTDPGDSPLAGFASLAGIIRAYATGVLGVRASAVNRSGLVRSLRAMGADDDLASALGDVLEVCANARFAASASDDPGALQAQLDAARAALRSLEDARKRGELELPELPEPSRADTARRAALWLLASAATLTLTAAPTPARAAWTPEQQESHRDALTAYEAQRWDDAARRWETLREANPSSPEILYNLGTTHARAGRLGQARVMLERAALRRPGDTRIQENLATVRNMVRVQTIAQLRGRSRKLGGADMFFWWDTARRITATWLAMIALLGTWLALAMWWLRARHLREEAARDAALVFCVLAAALAILSTALWMGRAHVMRTTHPVIVTTTEPTLREGPSTHAARRDVEYPLIEGTMLLRETTQESWVQVRLPDNSSGWLPVESIADVR